MKRILFVEDEPAFAVGMIDRLESEGYQVEWARTGPAGYDQALAAPFDLIVLDIMLPGKSGFDVCRDLRRQGINAPLLMLTARRESKMQSAPALRPLSMALCSMMKVSP